ncbi:MAG: zinc ribbon domain-containing protein [Chloroflexota bacterium]|nr:zinc ribbon domain-containing protein [Chloroflexota bacterium]
MKSIAGRCGKLIVRSGRRVLPFLTRHAIAITVVILVLVALGLVYRIWRLGIPAAVSSLAPLFLCLVLIVAVLFARGKIRQWMQTGVSRGQAAVRKHVVEEVVQEGIGRGEALLEKGVETAKGALTTLTGEVKADWEHHVTKSAPGRPLPRASRCPSCGRFLRPGAKFCDGCGDPVLLTCPHCGRTLRPQAKFCDGCGTALDSKDTL